MSTAKSFLSFFLLLSSEHIMCANRATQIAKRVMIIIPSEIKCFLSQSSEYLSLDHSELCFRFIHAHKKATKCSERSTGEKREREKKNKIRITEIEDAKRKRFNGGIMQAKQ